MIRRTEKLIYLFKLSGCFGSNGDRTEQWLGFIFPEVGKSTTVCPITPAALGVTKRSLVGASAAASNIPIWSLAKYEHSA